MSSQCGFPEVDDQELVELLAAQHPSVVIFIKGVYDLKFDRLMRAVFESEPDAKVVWMAKGKAPRYLGHFRISGDYNVIVCKDGAPVKRLIGIPPVECLCSAVADALSGVKAPPSPER